MTQSICNGNPYKANNNLVTIAKILYRRIFLKSDFLIGSRLLKLLTNMITNAAHINNPAQPKKSLG